MKWEDSFLESFEWGNNIINKDRKLKIADKIASMVSDGNVVGAGSGSTVYLALKQIAKRIKDESLNILIIPSSREISMACIQLNIPQTTLLAHKPDWTFDGADEVDQDYNLIKGRGGAMFREKLLIASSPSTYIIADPSKMVKKLGTHFPVPIEIFPEALTHVEQSLKQFPVKEFNLRIAQKKDGPVITENGNLILDVWFDEIHGYLESAIKAITGVIESGLFMHYNVQLITGDD
ncbi:ribose 5-phosphate isomerase A [Parabacteroides bouchesdurhonensis]|uniref:ribose 5-phosphate isomerase A n=1 Tax=Parabacteroides bouchesdurhonensis TaxID=1936995 RepID=UPI000C81BCC8|nr:ribose 5-phosphate isomerase A [Parabacteroides bouchesdurhonensis]RHJ93677.1 ribose 5-phosphate isomerase A [Bacteroides sp. AM07-16]